LVLVSPIQSALLFQPWCTRMISQRPFGEIVQLGKSVIG
jgi:hypothetical protein